MDIISITSKLEKIKKDLNLTVDEEKSIEISKKALLFIEIKCLKPNFIDYLKEFDRDLTKEQKEYVKKVEDYKKSKELKK